MMALEAEIAERREGAHCALPTRDHNRVIRSQLKFQPPCGA